MVSFTLDAVKFLLIYRYLQNTYRFKRGASPLPVPRVKAFALPCKSKRATLKAPRKCIYNHPTRYNPSIEMDTAS